MVYSNDEPALTPGWLRALLYFFVFLIVNVVLQGTLFPFFTHLLDYDQSTLNGKFPVELFTILEWIILVVIIFITWLFRKYGDHRSLFDLGFSLRNRITSMLLAVFFGAMLIGLGFFSLYQSEMLVVQGVQWVPNRILIYFLLTVSIAFIEEVAIRGYILHNLMQSMGKWWALLVSSLIFAFLHGINPNITGIAVLNIFLAGVLLGVYYIHQQNLWYPIALHFSWNFFQGPVFGFKVSGLGLNEGVIRQEVKGNAFLTGSSFGFEGSIILTVLLIIGSIGTHFYASANNGEQAIRPKT